MGGNPSIEAKLCSAASKSTVEAWKTHFHNLVNDVKEDSAALKKVSVSKSRLWDLVINTASKVSPGSDDYSLLMQGMIRFLRTKNIYTSIQQSRLRTLDPIIKGCKSSNADVAFFSLRAMEVVLSHDFSKNQNKLKKFRTKARAAFFEQKVDYALVDSLALYGKEAIKQSEGVMPDSKMKPETQSVMNAAQMCLKVIAVVLTQPKKATKLVKVKIVRNEIIKRNLHKEVVFPLVRSIDPRVRAYASYTIIGLLLNSYSNEVEKIQDEALVNGISLWALYHSIKPDAEDPKHNHHEGIDNMRLLFGLLFDGNRKTASFIRKVLPVSLLSGKYKKIVPMLAKRFPFEFEERDRAGLEARLRWQQYNSEELKAIDWNAVMEKLELEAEEPRLIWNAATKKTLLDSLLLEIEEFDDQSRLLKDSKWEYDGFEVLYPQLLKEYIVGGYVIRLLLTDLEGRNEYPLQRGEVKALMNKLFIKATVELNRNKKLTLVRTMSLVYDKFKDEFKEWTQVPYLVSLMQQKNDPVMRDLTLSFLKEILASSANVTSFVDSNGIQTLLQDIVAVHKARAGQAEVKKGSEAKVSDDFFEQVAARLSSNTLSVDQLALESLGLLRLTFETKPQYQKVIPRRIPALIPHLMQLMFAEGQDDLVVKGQGLLRALILKNRRLVPTLAKTGLFIFAMQTLASCSEELLRLVYETHMRQKEPYAKPGASVLQPYLPGPLVEKLRGAEDVGKFIILIKSESKSPYYIWGKTQMRELSASLDKYVAPLKAELKRRPDALFNYDVKSCVESIKYKSLKNELCVGNVYIRYLFTEEQKGETIRNPGKLAKALMAYMPVVLTRLKETKCSTKAVKDCQYVLKTQTLLVKKEIEAMTEYKAFDPLLEIMQMQGTGADTQVLAGSLVIQLLRMKGRRVSHAATTGMQATKPNVELCVAAGGTKKLAYHFISLVENPRTEDMLLLDSLEALVILSKNATEKMCEAAVEPEYKFLTSLGKLIDVKNPEKKMESCMELLEPFTESKNYKIPEALVDSGVILRLIQIAVEAEAKEEGPNYALNATKTIKRAVHTGSLPAEQKAKVKIRTVVDKLLTTGVFLMLENDPKGVEKVTKYLHEDVETPTIIWTTAIRNELHTFLQRMEPQVTSYGEVKFPDEFWSQDATFYAALKTEPVWDNVYLRLFAEEKIGYQLPEYLRGDATTKQYNEGFYHSLIKVLTRVGRTKGMLFEQEAKADSEGPPQVNRAPSMMPSIPFPDAMSPLDVLAILVRCILQILKTDPELHERKEPGLYDLLQLIVQPHGHLQASVLQVIECCRESQDSMKHVLKIAPWIVCMMFNSERTARSNEPSLDMVFKGILAVVECGAWPSVLANPPPGAKTFEDVELQLVSLGLPVLLAMVVSNKGKFAKEQRVAAAKLCGQLSAEGKSHTYRALHSLLTWQFGTPLMESAAQPEKLIEFFDNVESNPKVYWTKEVRSEVIQGIQTEAKGILEWQLKALESVRETGKMHKPCQWDYKSVGMRAKHPTFAKQLEVGKIFVYEVVDHPNFPIDPTLYLPPLWKRLELEVAKLNEQKHGQAEKVVCALLESVAIVVTNLPHVAEGFERERLMYLYSMLQLNSIAIQEKVMEVLLASSNKQVAMKSAMERLIKYAMPILAKGDTTDLMEGVLKLLLDLVRRSSPVVKQIVDLGGHLVLILICMGQIKNATKEVKKHAAQLIGGMSNDGVNGLSTQEELCNILTPAFKPKFVMKTEKLIAFFEEDHEHKERNWNREMREKVVKFLKAELSTIVPKMPSWDGKEALFDSDKMYMVWPRPSEPEEEDEDAEDAAENPSAEA